MKVLTNDGIGFLKGIGNPAGTDSLASELVGTELAAWFGLQVPEFCIIDVKDLTIAIEGGTGTIEHGPAFLSKELRGMVGDGTETMLKKLINPEDVTRLVVFDTWIRNWDRYNSIEQEPAANLDNLLFSPVKRRFSLIVFDHSHCFSEPGIDASINSTQLIEDPAVYGLFPSFRPYIVERHVREALSRLRYVTPKVVRPILASIPSQWGVSHPVREAWGDMICRRAAFVAQHLMERLLPQRALDFGG